MKSSIEVKDQAVTAALNAMLQKMGNLSPVLAVLGEDMVERTKQRFSTATAPDGTRWQSNTMVTLMNYLNQRGGFSKKTGKIIAKGQALAISKRPLQGKSGSLANQIFSAVTGNGDGLTLGSTMRYARMQQQGGTKAQFKNLWGDIPARPFLPVTATGELYKSESDLIVERIQQYLID